MIDKIILNINCVVNIIIRLISKKLSKKIEIKLTILFSLTIFTIEYPWCLLQNKSAELCKEKMQRPALILLGA